MSGEDASKRVCLFPRKARPGDLTQGLHTPRQSTAPWRGVAPHFPIPLLLAVALLLLLLLLELPPPAAGMGVSWMPDCFKKSSMLVPPPAGDGSKGGGDTPLPLGGCPEPWVDGTVGGVPAPVEARAKALQE